MQSDKPNRECVIRDCGELTGSSYNDLPTKQPDSTGDPYEDFPDDQKRNGEDLPARELLRIATELKGYGNGAIKTDPKLASEKYSKGIRYLQEYPEDEEPDVEKEMEQLKIILYSNLALCQNQMGSYREAEESASKALEMKGISDDAKSKVRCGCHCAGLD